MRLGRVHAISRRPTTPDTALLDAASATQPPQCVTRLGRLGRANEMRNDMLIELHRVVAFTLGFGPAAGLEDLLN
jgi:hypothetical protein